MKKSPASWLTTAILAVGIGVVTTLTLLVGSLIYASATGDSLRLPGVLEYQVSDDALAVQTSASLPWTVLLLTAVIGLPIAILSTRRTRRAIQ